MWKDGTPWPWRRRRLAGRGYDFGVIRDSVEELIGAIDCPIESDGEDEE